MQIRKDRCDVAEPRCGNSSKSILDTLKASQMKDVPARRELQKSSREATIAAAMVLKASVVRAARM